MLIKYNITKLREYIDDFNKISNMTLNVWDPDINLLTAHPTSIMPKYCRMIRSTKEGLKRCFLSDNEACSHCRETLLPYTHRCHAYLFDTAVPLLSGNNLLGFVMFGQIKDDHLPEATYENIKKVANELGLPCDELYSAYKEISFSDPDKIRSAINVLETSIFHLNSSYITLNNNELSSEIDRWIDENLNQPISIESICNKFGISKNKLYSLCNRWYGVTIGKHILDKRMALAKKYLLENDKKISQVCIDVGIPDYNYFSKVFKKYYGVPPKQYLKKYTDLER